MSSGKIGKKHIKNQMHSKNYVKEGATARVNKRVTEKNYTPGTYEHHHPSQCEHMLRSRPIHLKMETATEGKEMIKVIARENIRDLLVPGNDINVYPAIWQQNELYRIRDAGKIISKDERQRQLQHMETIKKRMELECEKRKEFLKRIDAKNDKIMKKKLSEKSDNGDSTGDENDQDNDLNKTIDRAFLAQQEQNEEVQQANRLILATKCHVIRDAQIAEKQEIERELREENLRLERMMLEERDKGLLAEDENRQRLKLENAKHAIQIKTQLNEREKYKMMEAERIEEEAKKLAQTQIAVTMSMMDEEKLKKEKKLQIRKELLKHNETNEYLKTLKFEEYRIADMRAQEYQRMKHERDKQIEHEKLLVKEQKQREADRLLKLQTKLLETKNEQAEMTMRRTQEEKEREFRRKEKEIARKRREHEQQLLKTRSAQLEEIKRTRAIQLARDEHDFQCVVDKLKKEEEREQEQQQRDNENRRKYREEVIKQINQNEMAKRELKRRDKTAYYDELERQQQRNRNIKNVIEMKIKTMKDANIPEKFIRDVERQLKI